MQVTNHLVYIYIIINSFLVGANWSDTHNKTYKDIVLNFFGLFLALPFLIICFIIVCSQNLWEWLDGSLQISFIWQIRNGHYLEFDEDWLRRINNVQKKRLQKKKLSIRDRRFVFCVDKINEVIKLEKEKKV